MRASDAARNPFHILHGRNRRGFIWPRLTLRDQIFLFVLRSILNGNVVRDVHKVEDQWKCLRPITMARNWQFFGSGRGLKRRPIETGVNSLRSLNYSLLSYWREKLP